MSQLPSRLIPAIVMSLSTTLALGLFLLHPSPVSSIEYWLFDSLARSATPSSADPNVVIVAIDEPSLSRYGRWPWPRRQFAELVQAISAARPAAVALNIVFPEPADGDDSLAISLASGPVVGAYAFDFHRPPTPSARCIAHPMPEILALSFGHSESPAFSDAPSAVCNVPALSAAFANSGFLNASPDFDGVLRRVPLFITHAGKLYPSLALAAVMTSAPVRQIALRRGPDGLLDFRFNDQIFRLDRRASVLPEFPRPGKLPRVSAAAILSGSVPASSLRGRTVFVGVTAMGIGDARVTALDPSYPGIDIQAGVAASLLNGNAFAPIDAARHWEALLILAAGLFSAVLFLALPPFPASLAILAAAIAAVCLPPLVLAQTGLFVSPLLPLAAFGGNAIAAAVLNARSHREKNRQVNTELRAAKEFMLAALASLTSLRDVETSGHLERVQHFLRLLCEFAAADPRFRPFLSAQTVELLVSIAPIHDIGKIGIPDAILQKPGLLTPTEMEIIHKHVYYGRQVLESARDKSGIDNPEMFDMCCALVYCHHERWDGSGYPQGLKGACIPLPARLLAVVDVYDALVTRRVYKSAMPHEAAVQEIAAGKGTQFDPDIVDIFLLHHHRFPLATRTPPGEGRAVAAAH